jgi:hypothetical protein
MLADSRYKSDSNKSNGGVISGLTRPQAAKTISGQNLTHWISQKARKLG